VLTSPPKFDDVQIVLADPRAHVRSALKVALTHAGLYNISQANSTAAVRDNLEQSVGPDILICDMGLDDGEICKMVSDLRHHNIGRNPFLCVIGMTWQPEAHQVTQMLDCGIDHLILAPVSPQKVMARITSLIHNRPEFVVTADYVGPDRRMRTRGDLEPGLVEAPNSLRSKAIESWNHRQFENQLKGAIGAVNTRKIDRQAEIIASLSKSIATQCEVKNGPAIVRPLIQRLTGLVIEMDKRAKEYGFHHVSELCRACVRVVKELEENHLPPKLVDMELLSHLGMAIHAALSTVDQSPSVAHDIVATVNAR
jgi:DNA-binding NarL/FixJ family response regulator